MIASSGIASVSRSDTTDLSARRHTVRHTWRIEAFRLPPGRMKALSGSISRSPASIELLDTRLVDARFGQVLAHLFRVRRGEQGANRQQIALDWGQHVVDARHRLHRPREPENGIQLVDVAIGGNAGMILRYASTAEQSRVAPVAGLCIDLHAGECTTSS
jgi:hypothetical protein